MAINNYKDFIIDMTETEEKNEEIKKAIEAKKSKPVVTYHLIGISGPDFILERKTSRSTSTLVMFISRNQCYIKDKNGENKIITNIDHDELLKFMKDLPSDFKWEDDDGNKLSWTNGISKSKYCLDWLMSLINAETIRTLINKGLIYFDINNYNFTTEVTPSKTRCTEDTYSFIYKCLPDNYKTLFKLLVGKRIGNISYSGNNFNTAEISRELNNVPTIAVTQINSVIDYMLNNSNELFAPHYAKEPIFANFGHSGLKDFLEGLFNSPITEMPSSYTMNYIFDVHTKGGNKIAYEFNSFKEYCLLASVRQGYATSLRNFINEWSDVLSLQMDIYEKIVDKYPNNLATMHNILSYKSRLLKNKIDERLWNKTAEELARYEYKGYKFMIISPKSKRDMIDEATQQSNCLSTYVERTMKGLTHIFFCRDVKDPETSLVTIEVTKEGRLNQVKAHMNRDPKPECTEFVNKWYSKVFLPIFNGEKEPEEVAKVVC